MENKYYTPEIEEFHVGLEYEVKVYKKDEWIKCKWTELNVMSAEFNLDFGQAYDLPKVTVPDTIRVKYLDREDIESLGFKHTNEINQEFEDSEDYVMGDWELSTWNEPKRQAVSIEKKSKFGKNTVHFAGIIKNKSELKRLLKQLGI